jgi:purine-binding chemotaxis protein CheW
MKTPEQYFLEKDFLPSGAEGDTLSAAEREFLRKYMGLGDDAGQGAVAMPGPARVESAPGFGPRPGSDAPDPAGRDLDQTLAEPDIIAQLKEEHDLQLVGFLVGDQEFTVPINVVQEVIRYVAPTRLPAAPAFIAGIVNLRGRVTPLVRMTSLVGGLGASEHPGFIVVCRRKGLQLGLMIDTVKTMYRVPQEKIDWSVEVHLGANVEYVAGLLKADDGKLIGVLSIDRIVEKVLKG